ncbi:hypothetical protein WJX84_005346 [Apatococcus fuscideae]|uniref:ABM domain-containing protein n=1 Tax=Apatococcus fuscideae TaxID=2026836 RepID=A0AAW1TBG7_9CHLO
MKLTMIAACLVSLALASPAVASTSSSSAVGGELYSGQNKDPEDTKAYVLIEYAVIPSKQSEFVAAFEQTASATKKEEGSVVYTLTRSVDENLSFWLYSEWTGMKAFAEHFNATYVKDFVKRSSELDVVYKLHILDKVIY